MKREFEFFITEQDQRIQQWSVQKEQDGSIFVGNDHGLMEELARRSQVGDQIDCRISGAWIEQCILHSVRKLLNPGRDNIPLKDRVVTGVTVDLTTSVAFLNRELTGLEKKQILYERLGELIHDPRLKIVA